MAGRDLQLGYRAGFAALYDPLVRVAMAAPRRASLAALGPLRGQRLLLPGIGTGLDIPQLPDQAECIGVDLAPAMLARARRRARECGRDIALIEGDAHRLPLADASIDCVLMHLILAVVPRPAAALAEASRVLRPGGRLVVLDKFLRDGGRRSLRRLISPLLARLATRTDVVFETLHAAHPELLLVEDRAAAAGGWFRRIELRRDD